MKIYFDENISPYLAEGLNILEKPIKEECEILSVKKVFGIGIKDEDWIPKLGEEDSVVITQDFKIQTSRSQNELYKKYKVGIFFISPPTKKKGYTYWEMVMYIIKNWQDFKKKAMETKKAFCFQM